MRDVQSEYDNRGIGLEEVGISEFHLPALVTVSKSKKLSTVAKMSIAVSVPSNIRGTHMSRLVESAMDFLDEITPNSVEKCHQELSSRLDCVNTTLRIEYDLFRDKTSPMSNKVAPMRYAARIDSFGAGDERVTIVSCSTKVTSLCPCSKEISDYGAHNQRGSIEIAIQYDKHAFLDLEDDLGIIECIDIAENSGSAQIYALVKRGDERLMTMQAYENPVFVEDMVRNSTLKLLRANKNAFRVTVSNDESIHDHNAYAIYTEPAWNHKYEAIRR